MALNAVEREWDRIKGLIAEEWDRLSEADIADVGGDPQRLVEKVRQRYSISLQEAEKQVRDFERVAGGAAGF